MNTKNLVLKMLIPFLFLFLSVESLMPSDNKQETLSEESSNAPKYNIIVFLTDDQCINSVGCYGNSQIKTPNIDWLAKEGTRFTNCYSNSSSCSPNRSVILTGLHNHTNGMYGLCPEPFNFSTFKDVVSLPTYLREVGYSSVVVGKLHIQPESVYKFDKHLLPQGKRNHYGMVEACREFIQSTANPFFIFYCTADPHVGHGKIQDSLYYPDRFGNVDKGYPGITPVKYSASEVIVPDYLPDIPETRAELAQYYQSVSRLDQGLGMLITMLKETGQYENTLIIYTSDNGHAMPMCKATLYDPGIHMPLIVRHPDQVKRGIVNNAMVSFTDLTPTILDYAGVSLDSKHFHGKSFKSVLEETDPVGWDYVFGSQTFHLITWYYPRRMIRTRDFKLIRNIEYELEDFAARQYNSTWQGVIKAGKDTYGMRKLENCIFHPEFELYDLKKDPHEIQNLADSASYAIILSELLQKLDNFQVITKDPWIPENIKNP